ncbi:MAG: hypothetical protein AAF529_10200 [Pseudomonadota bacterium]
MAYGGWAVYANWPHGEYIAWRSGCVQGGYSFALTFVMTLVTEWLYARLVEVWGGLLWLMVIICSVLFCTAYGIHMLVGTPEILMTILPGFFIGSTYTFVYVLGLHKQRNRAAESAIERTT